MGQKSLCLCLRVSRKATVLVSAKSVASSEVSPGEGPAPSSLTGCCTRCTSAAGCSLPVVPPFRLLPRAAQNRSAACPPRARPGGWVRRKPQALGSDVLIMEEIHYHFCHILLIRSTSLGSVHPQGRWLHKGMNTRWWKPLGAILDVANYNYL